MKRKLRVLQFDVYAAAGHATMYLHERFGAAAVFFYDRAEQALLRPVRK